MWGIHCDRPELDYLGEGFASLGWSKLPDLRTLAADRQALKRFLARVYPDAKPGAIPVWAGIFMRFRDEMAPGDLVVYPDKPTRTVNIGEIAGEYEWHGDVLHPHRRPVDWLETGIPRDEFSQAALWELGSSVTLFRIRRHDHEFEARLALGEADGAAIARAW